MFLIANSKRFLDIRQVAFLVLWVLGPICSYYLTNAHPTTTDFIQAVFTEHYKLTGERIIWTNAKDETELQTQYDQALNIELTQQRLLMIGFIEDHVIKIKKSEDWNPTLDVKELENSLTASLKRIFQVNKDINRAQNYIAYQILKYLDSPTIENPNYAIWVNEQTQSEKEVEQKNSRFLFLILMFIIALTLCTSLYFIFKKLHFSNQFSSRLRLALTNNTGQIPLKLNVKIYSGWNLFLNPIQNVFSNRSTVPQLDIVYDQWTRSSNLKLNRAAMTLLSTKDLEILKKLFQDDLLTTHHENAILIFIETLKAKFHAQEH